MSMEDKHYNEEPWKLKKGKSYIIIEKDKINRGDFYMQKDKERRLSLHESQARMTYHQLLEFGYKLQKQVKISKEGD